MARAMHILLSLLFVWQSSSNRPTKTEGSLMHEMPEQQAVHANVHSQHPPAKGIPIAQTDSVCCALLAGAIFVAWGGWAYFQGMPSAPLGLDSLATKVIFGAYVGLFLCTTFLTKSIEGSKGPDTKILVAALFVAKLLVSLVLWRLQDGSFVELAVLARREWRLILKYAVVALLFAVSDVLRLDFIQHTSPSSFHVLINLRIFFLALVWQAVMGYQLLRCHWFSIACISVGCLVKETPHLFLEGPLLQGQGLSTAHIELLCLMLCTSVGLVLNEFLLKRDGNATPTPLNFQNSALYLSGFLWMLLQARFSASHGGTAAAPVFQVEEWQRLMSPLPCLCLASLTALGIVTSYFLKKLSNIAKEVATGCEVLISLPLDTFIFGTHLGVVDLIGSGIVLFGVDIFARWPVSLAAPVDGASGGAKDLLDKGLPLPIPAGQKNDKASPK